MRLMRDEDFEDDDLAEGSDDFRVTQEDFRNLYIVPTDWTVQVLLDTIEKRIDLQPGFQRRGVWSPQAKSRFIESIFLGIPIPQILLAERQHEADRLIVLDGKQRLLTLKEFVEGRHLDGSIFALSGLVNVPELNGKSWHQIKEQFQNLSERFLGTTIRTTVLRGWRDDRILYEIFYRLNSGSVRLSSMELRMSLKHGPFLRHIVAWSESVGPIHNLLNLRHPDKRMADVELAIRHLAFVHSQTLYRGNLKDFLDKFCELQNRSFDRALTDERLATFEKAIESATKEFGEENVCRRYIPREERFDTRFNRALFDVQIGSFAHSGIREWAEKEPANLRNAFIRLSTEDPDFRSSSEMTTKSLTAFRKRFESWYSRVSDITDISLPVPPALHKK